jgi:ribosomal protein RSM22 (predicted rRNA methylase)
VTANGESGFLERLEGAVSSLPPAVLTDAYARLSTAYRFEDPAAALRSGPHAREAYLAARAPATYAAIGAALGEVAPHLGAPESLLDLGAGPGTASWAASEILPSLAAFTLIEADRPMAELGRRLAAASRLGTAHWINARLEGASLPESDLVLACYVLNELSPQARETVIRAAFRASRDALVLVEAGTPAGFAILRAAREALTAEGAHVIAPCTHEAACPMAGADWCHFAALLPRTAAHRQAKAVGASLETEKFAYLAVARGKPALRSKSRIVRRPMIRSGHVVLDLCAEDGLSRVTVSRRSGALYRASRDAAWGEAWPPDMT